MFVAGDIGGTKTALALYSCDHGPRAPIAERVFPSRESAGLEQIVVQFLEEVAATSPTLTVASAAFGVAGPVLDDQANITNLGWKVRRSALAEVLNLAESQVHLLNDLEATANAVPHLLPQDLQLLNSGIPVATGAPIAVLAPGTGLGQAYLTWDGSRYRPHASEGGHVDFAPCDQLQLELLNYLYEQFEHVSFERVVSGQGIPSIFAFLRDTGRAEEPEVLASALAEVADPTPVIMAGEGEFEICRRTLDVFVSILGAKAGNVALSLMSRGGVYLGGGIPPRILPRLQSDGFLEPFLSKGRFRALMAQIPVHVITNPQTALLGAAYAAAHTVGY